MYDRFEQLLEIKGVTAYRVAKETGINPTTFTEWKRGDYSPKRDKLKKIAGYFGVPIDYFYEDDKGYINKCQMDMAVYDISSVLRADQENLIKMIASLSPQEISAVGLFIETLKGKRLSEDRTK